eukprot:CAMPEP_0185020496 /NCGR_PEP_ID=MMETSP1103-20130426/3102_1 /TAXON_ID=36769 /ORGANISM="Paraphysomonas bandaiensis, Strain Caron Lab Isolate" /LENGTH=393 /DNA_ID=CAMNT_0027551429 /DNA_START=58 /DNA_END=1236 /DNA_ORIENTATION=+
MSSSSSSTERHETKIVRISFYHAKRCNERNYPYQKSGKAILTIDFMGHIHTLTDVGEALFHYYLNEKLQESLYSHLWRFQPVGNDYTHGTCLCPDISILSKDMKLKNQFSCGFDEDDDEDDERRESYMLCEGDELLFHYDEGSPTILMTVIESIYTPPSPPRREDYPQAVSGYGVEDENSRAKRARLQSVPVLTVTMDEAYPYLRERLFQGGVKFDIGAGCGFTKDKWAMIWGGGNTPAYNSSLDCVCAFENMDEAFTCFDRGIKKQISPGHPSLDKIEFYRDPSTGQMLQERCEDRHADMFPPFEVHVRPYPRSVPPTEFKSEYTEMSLFGMTSFDSDDDRQVVKTKQRWAFNFQLSEEDMSTLQDPSRFSFVKQFPKCAMWLSNKSKTAHW